jgi:hypothetical protein
VGGGTGAGGGDRGLCTNHVRDVNLHGYDVNFHGHEQLGDRPHRRFVDPDGDDERDTNRGPDDQ